MVNTLILSVVLFTLISFKTVADIPTTKGVYKFKDRTYLLQKFKNLPPKRVNRFRNSLSGFPKKVVLKKIMTEAKDQGDRGSCAYFSSTALIESIIKKNQEVDLNVSEEYLIYSAKGKFGFSQRAEGSFVEDNLRVFTRGFMLERDVPYQSSWFKNGLPCAGLTKNSSNAPNYCFSHKSPAAELLVKKITLKELDIFRLKSTTATIIEVIAKENIPVTVSLPVNPKGWDGATGRAVYSATHLKECKETPDACGGHSVLVYGYDLEKGEIYFKNSWGKDWGQKGFGILSFEYIDKYSEGSAHTVKIREDVDFPNDYLERAAPALIDESFQVLNNGESISTKFTGTFKNVRGRTLYISSFIGYKKDDSPANEPISNLNAQFVLNREEFQKEYGFYATSRFYKNIVNSSSISFYEVNALKMNLSLKTVDLEALAGKDTYLRISAYVYDDVDGWKKLFRVFKEIDLSF